MSIPEFDSWGLLPPGDYEATFDVLRESVLVHGTADRVLDGPWRTHLIGQAEILVQQLWQVGIEEIFLDGSYRVELYPDYSGLVALQDQHGNDLQFPAAFRMRRDTGEPKGIVKIVR